MILSLKYLVLDVNISIQSDKSLVLSQAATIFQWIKPGSPPSLKLIPGENTGLSFSVTPVVCIHIDYSKPVEVHFRFIDSVQCMYRTFVVAFTLF